MLPIGAYVAATLGQADRPMTAATPATAAPVAEPPPEVPGRLPAVPAVGVLIPRFPQRTQEPFWHQVLAWRAAGATVEVMSTARPDAGDAGVEFAAEAARQTRYLHPPPRLSTAAGLTGSPRRTAAALAYARRLPDSGPARRLQVAALVAAARELVDYCRDRNLRHVHGHGLGDAAHVLAMARRMGGPTYSLAAHADLAVYGADLRAKLAGCSAVACDGPQLLPQLVELGYPPDRAAAEWVGVDTDFFTPPDERQTDGPLRLITVARLARVKGHRFALDALARLIARGVEVTYDLVGEGSQAGDIEAEAARLGVLDRLRFRGRLTREGVRGALRSADVFVLPSVGLGEAGPVAAMEAMACGLPVVASRIGGLPAMVDGGETGFVVDQRDAAGLADALAELAAPARRRAMGDAARRAAVGRFDSRRSALRVFAHLRRRTPQTFGV